MFNDDQLRHRRALAAISPHQRCWCGWGLAGRCDTPDPCPPDTTLADRFATEQPCCGRDATRPDALRTSGSHYAGCGPQYRDAFFAELGLIDLGGEG